MSELPRHCNEELKKNIKPFLDRNPTLVARRVAHIAWKFARVAAVWSTSPSTRGETLRNAVADLGPVFVKFGQTLASVWRCRLTSG